MTGGREDGKTEGAAGLTPFQTVGPFFAVLPLEGENTVGSAASITIEGVVRDGAGAVVPDALIETWQADAAGRLDAVDGSFRGFARAMTDASGRYEVRTVMPGSIGDGHAPHVLVGILARGILTRRASRLGQTTGQFEFANAADRLAEFTLVVACESSPESPHASAKSARPT